MAYGMAGMPGNQRQVGLPRGMSGFPVVGRGLGGMPVRVTVPPGHYIATPTATPAAFGDPFEGGFYTGMIWNELVQSASAKTIGIGVTSFEVADMKATPLVYVGQTLEVRSRANPVNKMIGVVTSAMGTALTINVTSVGGSGAFTDWSIMSRYRVIVAPKATGENASTSYDNGAFASVSECITLSEGRKATQAMVVAGGAAGYPAAFWCNALSIAGRSDWYLPARDELELCYRNLKPSADSNYTTPDRLTSGPNYMKLGAYGDVADTHGLANNTSPVSPAHSAGSPAQVAAGMNFRTGESEAFSAANYYSSTELTATSAWGQTWSVGGMALGSQTSMTKSNNNRVRAVRRSII